MVSYVKNIIAYEKTTECRYTFCITTKLPIFQRQSFTAHFNEHKKNK
jgi:hypothetical protein